MHSCTHVASELRAHGRKHEICNISSIISVLLVSSMFRTRCIVSMFIRDKNFKDRELSLLPENNSQILLEYI